MLEMNSSVSLIMHRARVVSHACTITLQLAVFTVSRGLFNRIPAAIQRLRSPQVPT